MAQIPKSFIQDILNRTDIIEIIDIRLPLKKKGNNYLACCPFHQEKSPSFTVSAVKQFFHCFGCGEHGNVISFLMKYDKFNFVESIEYLAKRYGLSIPYEGKVYEPREQNHPNLYQYMARASVFYQEQLSLSVKARHYLSKRGLKPETIETFCLGYAPDAWDSLLNVFRQIPEAIKHLLNAGLIKAGNKGHYDIFRDRIIFPIRDRKGQVVAFGGRILDQGEPKYLNSPETAIFFKSSEIYGLYEAIKANRQLSFALLVEGYMDVVMLRQHGFTNALAVMGTSLTRNHLERILRETQTLVFCFDGDAAGQKAAWRSALQLMPLMRDGILAKFIFLPEEHDPDSYVQTFGRDKFLTLIDGAQSLADFFWQHLLAETDLQSFEGKAKLNKLAMPALEAMSEGAFKEMMLNELQKYTGVNYQFRASPTRSVKKIQLDPVLTPARKCIAMLLQYPDLAKLVSQDIYINESAKILLLSIVDFIKQHPGCSTASIIEAWREHDYFALFNQLAMVDLLAPEKGIEQEFLGLLKSLEHDFFKKLEDTLMGELRIGSLSVEKRQLLLLIQKMQKGILSQGEKQGLLAQLKEGSFL